MKKIMIVEDDKVIREELIDLLKGANYQTSFVRDFANSFNEIIDAKADLIILDINIPYTNGEILLKNIRKSLGVENILSGSVVTFMFLIFIYGIYFIVTYLCNRNIIREK